MSVKSFPLFVFENVENSSSVLNRTQKSSVVKNNFAYLIHKRDMMIIIIICTELRVLSKAGRSIKKI